MGALSCRSSRCELDDATPNDDGFEKANGVDYMDDNALLRRHHQAFQNGDVSPERVNVIRYTLARMMQCEPLHIPHGKLVVGDLAGRALSLMEVNPGCQLKLVDRCDVRVIEAPAYTE